MAALVVGDTNHGVESSSSSSLWLWPPINNLSATTHVYAYEHTTSAESPFTGEVLPLPDILVRTSAGLFIPAHSPVLASASPVLKNMIYGGQVKRLWSSDKSISILGVPCEAVLVFIEFLYSSRLSEEQMEQFGIHLLALSHVYSIPQLKQVCSKELGRCLTIDNVVDVLQLARMCDTPDLYLKCLKLVYLDFNNVEETEAWKFLQYHDPWLELEILNFIDETEQRKRKTTRQRKEESLFMELSVAMECLEHIFKEGCTNIRPHDSDDKTKKKPCSKFGTCRGLQLLICHFASCKNRVNSGCSRCKRMWQLLRLHSSICELPDSCSIPLCRKLKMETRQVRKKKHERRWKLLTTKVAAAKVMSSLSTQVKRKRAEDIVVVNVRDGDRVHGCSCSPPRSSQGLVNQLL